MSGNRHRRSAPVRLTYRSTRSAATMRSASENSSSKASDASATNALRLAPVRAGAQTESGGVGSSMRGHSLRCALFRGFETNGLSMPAAMATNSRTNRKPKPDNRQSQERRGKREKNGLKLCPIGAWADQVWVAVARPRRCA